MINQSIKFFTIFLLAFNVFAGGDDRDEEYYENLDDETATALHADDVEISYLERELGIKKSSAQITDLYTKEALLNKQVSAIIAV